MSDILSPVEQKYYLAVFRGRRVEQGKALFSCPNELQLLQFVDVHCKTSNGANAFHRQPCDEITFTYSGQGDVSTNGVRTALKSGQVHLCFEGNTHQIFPSKTASLRFFCMGFHIEPKNPLYPLYEAARAHILRSGSSTIDNRSDLLPAFQTILSALHEPTDEATDRAIITNAANYILISVFQSFLSTEHASPRLSISTTGSLLYYVTSYLKNNVYHKDALATLSVDTGYSYSYLSHLFSEKMGQSLQDFFAHLRMDTATELLREKSVTEVAELLGYSSIHAFTRAYKAVCGISPGQVRKKEGSAPNTLL